MPPDLWARFDIPPDVYKASVEYKDRFHLVISDLEVFGEMGLCFACYDWVTANDASLTIANVLAEASRTVEHRKKCPDCYDYWMKRRETIKKGTSNV